MLEVNKSWVASLIYVTESETGRIIHIHMNVRNMSKVELSLELSYLI